MNPTTSFNNRKHKDTIFNNLKTQSNLNNTIEYLSGRIEKNEYFAHATELVQSKNTIMDLLKRIDERKARTYHNSSGIAKKEEAGDTTVKPQ